MTDLMTLAQRYLDAWNETDATTRRTAVAELFTEDGSYVDPLAEVQGLDAIDGLIAAVQGQFPDFRFSLLGEVDGHHDVARFSWGLGPVGAEPPIVGFDVAVTDGQGRIASVTGFLDRVPA